MPGYSGSFTTGIGARAAEVEILDWSAVVDLFGHGSLGEKLAGDDVQVVDVANGVVRWFHDSGKF